MSRPVIGLTGFRRDLPTYLGERTDLYTLDPSYCDGVARAGGLPLILPHGDDPDVVLDLLDGLVLTGGGALLKEKIVAASARQFIVLVDHTKQVPVLGGSFPLPIEVIPFGWGSTAREIETLTKSRVVLRERNGAPFRTEAGNLIVDVHLARIDQPGELEIALNQIPGIVETGLFVDRTNILIVGSSQGVQVYHAPGK